ncbi:hypothetical protein TSUD_239000 [Trifolium subterraneum]|uniref:Uncharacterized protein n=1 Tax=Trifolium subterraneum TaxID=3900 RepID=A0A2Z6NEG9_TRISU|nr:hypothetical protein TSUD_239000 [Trifolium subterraneum]
MHLSHKYRCCFVLVVNGNCTMVIKQLRHESPMMACEVPNLLQEPNVLASSYELLGQEVI